MSDFRKCCSFSFTIGLALCLVCLAYIPQWQNYASRAGEPGRWFPYLAPWTVLSVSILSLSLAITAIPVHPASPVQVIVSKALGVCVFCFATVFLLEYLSGIRVPDLDLFLPLNTTDHSAMLHCARPTPQSATTILLFALATLFYDHDTRWRLRMFQGGIVAALAIPGLAALGYIANQPSWPMNGLCIPVIILFIILGSGFFGLCCRPKTTARNGSPDRKRFPAPGSSPKISRAKALGRGRSVAASPR
jgi:hypothetical protein